MCSAAFGEAYRRVPAKLNMEFEMRELNLSEFHSVSGGMSWPNDLGNGIAVEYPSYEDLVKLLTQNPALSTSLFVDVGY